MTAQDLPQGFTVWFTGMSGAGKTTMANLLARRLREAGARVELLDGDLVRLNLCRGLGFTKQDRDENVRRIGFVCEILSRNGVIAIAAAISPYRAARDAVRARIPHFVEVYMECPLAVLAARDTKGLYKRALAGEIPHFTGVSDPYEPPIRAELRIDSSSETPESGLERLCARLENLNLVRFQDTPWTNGRTPAAQVREPRKTSNLPDPNGHSAAAHRP